MRSVLIFDEYIISAIVIVTVVVIVLLLFGGESAKISAEGCSYLRHVRCACTDEEQQPGAICWEQ